MNEIISRQKYKERIAKCVDCPSYLPKTNRCKDCGCFLLLKAVLVPSTCPQNKW